jgi:hypothetical protein
MDWGPGVNVMITILFGDFTKISAKKNCDFLSKINAMINIWHKIAEFLPIHPRHFLVWEGAKNMYPAKVVFHLDNCVHGR